MSNLDAICRGEWPAGTRVRCVLPTSDGRVVEGREYTVAVSRTEGFIYLNETYGNFVASRFKPVVRVPMGRDHVVDALVDRYFTLSGRIGLMTENDASDISFALRRAGLKVTFP